VGAVGKDNCRSLGSRSSLGMTLVGGGFCDATLSQNAGSRSRSPFDFDYLAIFAQGRLSTALRSAQEGQPGACRLLSFCVT